MPAVSKKQQKFMGMVHAVQKGKMDAPSSEVADAARSMKPSDATDFASTKHKGLPEKKSAQKGTPMTTQEKKASLIKLANMVTNYQLLKAAGLLKVAVSSKPRKNAQ